jgi:hypothetical protein
MSHRTRSLLLVLLPLLPIAAGCGSGQQASTRVVIANAPELQPPQQPAPQDKPKDADGPPPGNELPAERKIVFTGVLEIEVKDFAAARAELYSLMARYKAYYAKTEVAGDSGKRRSGTFVIKVPVEHFQPLVDALVGLGNPVKNATDSQDVTEEFVDTTARVKNLRVEEETLNKLLKDAAGRLDDVFRIREQIRKVRGEIERDEARVQALGKMAALSTLTVTLREIEPYLAPNVPKPSEPPFDERASGTFAASVGVLRDVGEALGLFGVAIAPWLPVAVVLGVPVYLWLRSARRGG